MKSSSRSCLSGLGRGFCFFGAFGFWLGGLIWDAQGGQLLCFARDKDVYVASLDGTGERLVVEGGTDPEISPDGTKIAYTDTSAVGRRTIAVMEVEGQKTTVFRDLPTGNAYGPTWSPDGQSLLFQILNGEHWALARTSASGTDLKFLKIPGMDEADIFSPAWAPDGKTIYCQDLTDLYQVDLDGGIKARWRLSSLLPRADMSSSDRIQPLSSGESLLLDVQLDQDGPIQGWDGPPAAVVVVDIGAREVRQLGPDNIYAWGVWRLSDNLILFTGTEDGKHFSIYRMALDNPEPKVLIPVGTNPSASQQ